MSKKNVSNSGQRVLKDVGNKLSIGSTLPMLPPSVPGQGNHSSNNAVLASLAFKYQASTANDNSSVTSTTSVSSTDKLKNRLKDLEYENEKLRNHLKESEDVILNYRGFLSSKTGATPRSSINNSNSVKSNDSATQTTEVYISSNALKDAEANILSLKIEIHKLTSSSSSNCSSSKVGDAILKEILPADIDTKDNNTSEASSSRDDAIDSLKATIVNLESTAVTHIATIDKLTYDRHLLQRQISSLHSVIGALNCDYSRHKTDMGTQMNACIIDLTSMVADKHAAASKRIVELNGRLNDKDELLVSLTNALNEKDLLLVSKRIEFDSLKEKYDSQVTVSTSSTTATIITATSAAPTPTKSDHACDPLSPATNKAMMQEQYEKQIASMQDIVNAECGKVREYHSRFHVAASAMYNLQEKHAMEVAAIKHTAHCKDLGRIAAMREATIEKDKLLNEIKYIKEVCNTLSFALNTAEQSLSEVQPEVVLKLIEGRQKRMKLIERAAVERRKDVDQRSADTCAVSTAHLESFVTKAYEKHMNIKNDVDSIITAMANTFSIDDIELKIYVDKSKDKKASTSKNA